MLKRLAKATMIVGLLGIVGLAGYTWWLTSQGWHFLAPAGHGEKIGEFEDVGIFGNDGANDRGDYGLQFECVEFINRFYAVRLGHKNMTQSGNAEDYFRHTANKGLVAYPNGSNERPRKYDSLVFDGGDNDGNVGHIALITEVGNDRVTFVQQNAVAWKHGWFAKDIWRDSLPLTEDHGTWTIAQGRNRLPVIGWSRPAAKK